MEFKTEIVQHGVLTPREIEILQCVCDAKTDKQIARMLAISIRTVSHHIDHIHEKLGISQKILNKRVALLRVALAQGLVRVLCLVLSVSASVQVDSQFPAARVRCARPSVSRRFD
jgi:DNA-binding CsgD family transcriptional regulator